MKHKIKFSKFNILSVGIRNHCKVLLHVCNHGLVINQHDYLLTFTRYIQWCYNHILLLKLLLKKLQSSIINIFKRQHIAWQNLGWRSCKTKITMKINYISRNKIWLYFKSSSYQLRTGRTGFWYCWYELQQTLRLHTLISQKEIWTFSPCTGGRSTLTILINSLYAFVCVTVVWVN